MAARFRCLQQVSKLCRSVFSDGTPNFARKRCLVRYTSCCFSPLQTEQGRFRVFRNSCRKDTTTSVNPRENRFLSSTTVDDAPKISE